MNKSPEEYPLLVAQEGPLKGQRWQLSQTIVLGREPTCDVVVADRQISRFHARLTPTPEGVIFEDLGSKNGTHHNGVTLTAPVPNSRSTASSATTGISLPVSGNMIVAPIRRLNRSSSG